MSWMEQLVQTYDENESLAGKAEVEGTKAVLPPVGHIVQNAQIEMTLDGEGNLIAAAAIAKEQQPTLIPCTPDSASRTSSPAPHPLHDQLPYVAHDYDQYNKKTPSKDKHPYTLYKELLGHWAESSDTHPKVRAVYAYISNHDVIHDLIRKKVLFQDEKGNILEKWPYKDREKPLIFSVTAGTVLKALVRFRVVISGDDIPDIWKDRSLQRAYQHFYQHCFSGEKVLCYATGRMMLPTDKHYKGIRFPGDGAKLISSNDTSGYTFRGRFQDGAECLSVGYETSQKAMNVLKWLIRNQGYTVDGRVFLAWGRSKIRPPRIFSSTLGLTQAGRQVSRPVTMRAWADTLTKVLQGYHCEFERQPNSQVDLIILDAATPGRLSICYYDEMAGQDFVDRIKQWHTRGCWRQHSYDAAQNRALVYFGVPTPKNLVKACQGENVSDKKMKLELERIFYCIVQDRSLPLDMARRVLDHVVRKASEADYYKWQQQLLEPACSIICNRLNHEEVGYTVALDENKIDRSYLYGRMLAVADQLERSTYEANEWGSRQTNAMKYMAVFASRPAATWELIQQRLLPYEQKRERYGGKEKKLLARIGSMFREEDFLSDEPLDGRFLLGYYCQQYAIEQYIASCKEKKDNKAAEGENA